MSSTNVFVAGSRALSRLNDAVRVRLERIISEGHHVLVGDANGADKAIQQFLAGRHYQGVTVYCTGARCRNNVGHWPLVNVPPPDGIARGFDFCAAKDRAMAHRATHGFMLWDGESRGTLTNIRNLIDQQRPVLVYLSPSRTFSTIRTESDLEQLRVRASSGGGEATSSRGPAGRARVR